MEIVGRTIGLDLGEARIGVAVSDLLGITAQPLKVIPSRGPECDAEAIRETAKENEAIRVVVGMPLDQNGEMGPQALKVQAFVDRLKAMLDIEVVVQDERFSTVAAHRSLAASGVRAKGRKNIVDIVAAQHILQTYLDRLAFQRARSRP
ncbi:MAG TPA: Holliday junction resolvase RuvX [Candidatus Hydrogenedentes bacterium]|nr:Holliday junction resolvase RuvX [Candidatus Hydrogenedentota bacterium]HPG69691.1 Holliday junction resolvase RuvX [Candidatus Hydrogenedentota bacterium]